MIHFSKINVWNPVSHEQYIKSTSDLKSVISGNQEGISTILSLITDGMDHEDLRNCGSIYTPEVVKRVEDNMVHMDLQEVDKKIWNSSFLRRFNVKKEGDNSPSLTLFSDRDTPRELQYSGYNLDEKSLMRFQALNTQPTLVQKILKQERRGMSLLANKLLEKRS